MYIQYNTLIYFYDKMTLICSGFKNINRQQSLYRGAFNQLVNAHIETKKNKKKQKK